jgi:hypothetical protein
MPIYTHVLAADEEDLLARTCERASELLGSLEAGGGLREVEEIGAVLSTEEERSSRRMAARTRIAEVHAGVLERLYGVV